MTYALDTNTLIYFFKGLGRVADHLLARPPTDIAVPVVVVYEIDYGLARSERPEAQREQLESLLGTVDILPFDRDAASRAGQLRAALEREGRAIGPMDTLIAGTALAHGATLVTHNTAEFRRVADLKVVDWFD